MAQESLDRLQFLIVVGEKELRHLSETSSKLAKENIDEQWVNSLESNSDLSERVDAFVVRFGRLQDHLGDKLIPELIKQMLEKPTSAIDNLNRMEKLGLISSVDDWIVARNLRNKLVHEYVVDALEFALSITKALKLVALLEESYLSLSAYGNRFLQ